MLLLVVQISHIMNVATVLSSLEQLIILQLLVYSGDHVLLNNNTRLGLTLHKLHMESSSSEFIYAIISRPLKRLTRGLFNFISRDIITV